MAPFIKKLSYKNADEKIKKLLEITRDIPDNKWIEDRFDIKSSVSGIAGQEIAI